jgi:hypothetical protein
LERFHKEVNIFRRKLQDDERVDLWMPSCVRTYNLSESHVPGLTRLQLKVGAGALVSRAPIRRLLGELDAAATKEDPMEISPGDRVKIARVPRNKGEALFDIAKVVSITSSTAQVVLEGEAEEKTVSRRLITRIIPDSVPTEAKVPAVGQIVLFSTRKGMKVGLVLKVTRYSVEYQLLGTADTKKALRKRRYLPVWQETENATVMAEMPPEDASPVSGQVALHKLLAWGDKGPRNTLPVVVQAKMKE